MSLYGNDEHIGGNNKIKTQPTTPSAPNIQAPPSAPVAPDQNSMSPQDYTRAMAKYKEDKKYYDRQKRWYDINPSEHSFGSFTPPGGRAVGTGILYGGEQAGEAERRLQPGLDKLYERLDQKSPTQELLKQSGNERKAEASSNMAMSGVKGGTAARNLSGIDRQTQMDITNALYQQDTSNIKNYLNAQANVANMYNAYEMGWAGIANNKAPQVANPQNNLGNLFGILG